MSADRYDVVVIGGGAAGLSAATILSRSRRRVLVVDAGDPRNARAGHVHGYLGREGAPPHELLASGREEVRSYGGEVRPGRVVDVTGRRGDFTVALEDGSAVHARRLLLATGVTDVLPDIDGLADRWGRDVLHCPYCHGWEVRDRRVGVIPFPFMPTHVAQLFRQLTDRVTLFAAGVELDDEQRHGLEARGIDIVEGAVAAVEVHDDALTGVRLVDGDVIPLDALAVATRLEARAELAERLGAEMIDVPVGRHVSLGPMGRTTVPGLWSPGTSRTRWPRSWWPQPRAP
ncbi:MAG: NAD(P)/FAD-dependent oxidoreductase [Ilumatobacteraceae bacterium]